MGQKAQFLPASSVLSWPSSELTHRVRTDVLGDRLAFGVADGDRARVVHAAPDAGVVSVFPGLRDARVGAARLAGCGQRERLSVVELAEQNGRRSSVEAWV